MSAFARLCGTEEPKLPVWPTIAGMTRVMDGEITLEQFAADPTIQLSTEEEDEVLEYLDAIETMVTARVGALVTAGVPMAESVELARAIVNSKMMHALLRAELGTHTEASFREVFGL